VVDTTSGRWSARNVIIATGWCDQPAVPDAAARLDGSIAQVTASTYRNPAMLPAGGVLVVGASATGLQLADELGRAGRRVLLAVGNHTRMPRTYRGMDIYWWLERTGTLDRTIGELPDPAAARREPSLQLVGRPDHRTLDLAALATAGVRLAGRLVDIDGQRAGFSDDLPATVATADARMARVLAAIDAHIVASRLSAEVLDPDPPRPLPTLSTPDSVHLRRSGITSVIWATGHRRTYPWLHVPVLDSAGEIRQYRGVTPVPGLYVLGQRFQHFRSSNFIYGVGRDAAFVADHLVSRCPSTLRP
jgi:putative flavoprotein involved in K+ transport